MNEKLDGYPLSRGITADDAAVRAQYTGCGVITEARPYGRVQSAEDTNFSLRTPHSIGLSSLGSNWLNCSGERRPRRSFNLVLGWAHFIEMVLREPHRITYGCI